MHILVFRFLNSHVGKLSNAQMCADRGAIFSQQCIFSFSDFLIARISVIVTLMSAKCDMLALLQLERRWTSLSWTTLLLQKSMMTTSLSCALRKTASQSSRSTCSLRKRRAIMMRMATSSSIGKKQRMPGSTACQACRPSSLQDARDHNIHVFSS